ncbi:phosphopantothenoylcysteine decarboxylase [Solibacillus daqui]|uniref:phosphopantothenoylcysteine decarboxylase domain-containing protein n=1 Tax=Solibacillus daqui TaxID=2912187 RepID=UPI002366E048|nr:phosphopantothenoylcysteine decarboxylase [Solibacillus daqui]
MLSGKKILITSGGTFEKWDNVRGHTNLSKGTMGCYLAEAAYAKNAEVIYMHGIFTQLPEHKEQMRLVKFEGIEDLGQTLKQIVETEHIDYVIMAVAGSDWIIDKVFDQSGNELTEKGKMPSDEPPIIHFKKAPKILAQVKNWAPNTTLIGFKLEATEDEQFLIERATTRMQAANADYMVANSSKSLYGAMEPHLIISKTGAAIKRDGKEDAAKALMDLLK